MVLPYIPYTRKNGERFFLPSKLPEITTLQKYTTYGFLTHSLTQPKERDLKASFINGQTMIAYHLLLLFALSTVLATPTALGAQEEESLFPYGRYRRRQQQSQQESTPTSNGNVAYPNGSLVPLDVLWQPNTTHRAGIVDVIDNPEQEQEQEQLGLCHIALYTIFSVLYQGNRYPFGLTDVATGGVAAAHLALHMLNQGDGSIVPEIQGLNDTCPLRFTLEVLDSAGDAGNTVRSVTELLNRGENERQVCAFSGPLSSSSALPAAILTGMQGRPQMSAMATASQLDNKETFPLFARLITSDAGHAVLLVLYLKSKGITHLGVIHWPDEHGSTFSRALFETATEIYPDLQIVAVDIPSTNTAKEEDYVNAITTMKRTQFKWFYAIGSVDDNIALLKEATRQGIAGSTTETYVWLFYESTALYFDGLTVPRDSDLGRAAKGVGLFGEQTGRPGMPVYDKFVQRWKGLDNDVDMTFLDDRLPRYPDSPDFERTPARSAMFDHDPSFYAAVVFDEIVLMGLSACKAAKESSNSDDSSSANIYVDGSTMYRHIVNTTFSGATGNVTVDPETGSRKPTTAIFHMANVVEDVVNETHVTFRVVDSHIMMDGVWIEEEPFIYNDGKTHTPGSLPKVKRDDKYIGSPLRITGFIMAGLLLVASVISAIWTVANRKAHVVKASQPIFLLLLCMGTLIMGFAIIPLGIDDELASTTLCSLACMSSPWFASVGFALVFAALFSKTWRVNRIMLNPRVRRIKLTARDVMAPLLVILLLNFALLTAWTWVSPLKWEREESQKDEFGRNTTSRGFCTSDGHLPFVIALAVVDVGALLLASYQSYQARAIATEFAETEYITRAIVCMLLVCFVGVPIMIIVSEDPKANYFAMASIIFVLCTAVLYFIFVPKVKANLKGGFDAKRAIRQASSAGSGFVSDESGVQILENSVALDKLRTENEELRQLVKDLEQQLGNSTEVIGSGGDLAVVSAPDPIMECSPESEQSK